MTLADFDSRLEESRASSSPTSQRELTVNQKEHDGVLTQPSALASSQQDQAQAAGSTLLPRNVKSEHLDTQLAATVSALIFATIWGVLARLGLVWVGGFSSSTVFPLIWAQIAGCLVMGANVERKSDIEALYPPLFAAIGTGSCGSLTTFSSFIYEVFLEFANDGRPSAGRFEGFMNGFGMTVITLGMSTVALRVGVHLATAIPPRPRSDSDSYKISKPAPAPKPRLHRFVIVLGPAFWAGSAFLLAFGPHSWRHRATFAIVLGPPGTLLRFYLARKLNTGSAAAGVGAAPTRFDRFVKSFPLGTFIANMLAVLVEAVMAILQRRQGRTSIECSAVQGVMDGFCGSLSTVSTFVVELTSLNRRDGYVYAFTSWVVGQLLMVVVLGSWIWSGDRGPVCSP